jgi:phosphate starvation-inducible protein PhoH and related proteins
MGKPKSKQRQSNVTYLREQESNQQFFERSSTPQQHPKTTPSGRKYQKNLTYKSENQKIFGAAIDACDFTSGEGPAGTGKSYIAVLKGIEWMEKNPGSTMILGRPAVEAGEELGFLPGDPLEKVDPYMQPLYDILLERMSARMMHSKIQNGIIRPIPIAYMRGRTFNNAYIVIDEAQNATYSQLKMIYTRLGLGSKMVFVGDPNDQTDIGNKSGYRQFITNLSRANSNRMAFCKLEQVDVVRHPLLAETLQYL